MSEYSTTVQGSVLPTIEEPAVSTAAESAERRVREYWRTQPTPSVLRALEEFPSLLENKSLLMDFVVQEFQGLQRRDSISLVNFCMRFEHLGSSMEQSIFRALEVQRYLDRHPELLEFVVEFEWPRPGDQLAGFHVVEELGRGALARAYLCREAGVAQREVVVKVAHGGCYEAEMLGRLDHVNIVPIYSVVNDQAKHVSYICMPYRGRSTLQDLVDRLGKNGIPRTAAEIYAAGRCRELLSVAPSEPSRTGSFAATVTYVDGVLELAIQLATALEYAHRAGVYHGDLKPSNVLLTPAAQPLLIDFNLASDAHVESGPRGGTLAYMSPEQLQALHTDACLVPPSYDARSEVYSFGVLLFQLLTGEAPFVIDDPSLDPRQVAQRILDEQRTRRPLIRAANPAVNRSLEGLVCGCLAVNPVDRPQSMGELRRQLLGQRRGVAQLGRWTRARPRLTTFWLGTAVAGLLGTMAYLNSLPLMRFANTAADCSCNSSVT